MSSGEIQRARARVEKRKEAAGIVNEELSGEDKARLGLSGTDIDFDELIESQRSVLSAVPNAAAAGVPLPHLLFGMWVEGLVVGLAIAEDRAQDDG